MKKISISVKIPALNGVYDFIIPEYMSVRDAQQLIVRILVSEYGISQDISNLMLFVKDDGKILQMECNFAQLGIFDGAHLVLM